MEYRKAEGIKLNCGEMVARCCHGTFSSTCNCRQHFSRVAINRGGALILPPFSLSLRCAAGLRAGHLASFTSLLHMLATISPSAHDLSQSMPYSHSRTTSRSALPDLIPPSETKTCPGCQQTVMDENGGVVIAFG